MLIQKNSVSKQVIDYLKNQILDGGWEVGAKIPSENTLTRELGVSRASIRLAIQQFVGLGVLESVHGKGTFLKNRDVNFLSHAESRITDEDCRNIADVLAFRMLVEPEAAFLAAQKADQEMLRRLRLHFEATRVHAGDRKASVIHDNAFHLEICRTAGNPVLEKSVAEVFARSRQSHIYLWEIFGHKHGLHYHSRILKALETRKPNQARLLMHEHLLSALDQLPSDSH